MAKRQKTDCCTETHKQRIRIVTRSLAVADQYIFVLEQLVPEHFKIDKLPERAKWAEKRRELQFAIQKWNYL